ncbi:MAG: cache domain-containing protein, partial [Defluviitaleaceae bacterium]|nr:cache domain-containing protein [Defluviitaleaceae bacterium]
MSNMIAMGVYYFIMLLMIMILVAARTNEKARKNKILLCINVNLLIWMGLNMAEQLLLNIGQNVFVWNMGLVPPGFAAALLFVLMYNYFMPERKLPTPAYFLVFAIPVLTTIVALTANNHSLLRNMESLTVWPRDIEYTRGMWFYVHTAGAVINTIAGVAVLIKALGKEENKRPAAFFIAGIAIMIFGVVLTTLDVYLMNINPASVSSGVALIVIFLTFSDKSQSVFFRLLNTLKSRITFPAAAVVFMLIVVSVLFAARSARLIVEDMESDRVNDAFSAVSAYLDSLEQQTIAAASALAGSAELIRLINAGDRMDIWRYTAERRPALGVDSIIVTDAQGVAVARSLLPDRYGDDVSGGPSISAGILGNSITVFMPTPTAPIVLTTAMPIFDDGQIIGVVAVNFDIGMNHFLDNLKDIFGVEFMVFVPDGAGGAVSASSTLVNPETNDRIENLPAESHIVSAVLGRGQNVVYEIDLFGSPYLVSFSPLAIGAQNPAGMLFLGYSLVGGIATIGNLQREIIMINLAGLAIAAVFMFFMMYKSLKPLDELRGTVKEVAAGNVAVNIDRAKINTDEIGMLTYDMANLVDTIKNLVDDFEKMTKEHLAGHYSFMLDESKYAGAYSNLARQMKAMTDFYVQNTNEIINVVSNYGDGNFDYEMRRYEGEWEWANETMAALRQNFVSIAAEISRFTQNATNGIFDEQADDKRFKGSWAELVCTLNELMKAVELPLVEIERNMELTAKGDFTRLEGDFKGLFEKVKKAVNFNNKTTLAYISEITEVLERMAQGDLTVTVSGNFIGSYAPIKTALQTILQSLNKTVASIQSATGQVVTGAEQINNGAMQLAEGSSRQNAAILELTESMQTIDQKAKESASNAANANERATSSTAYAKQGDAVVNSMLESIDR